MNSINKNQYFLLVLKIICSLFIFTTFFLAANHRTDPDFGWHVKVGEEILVTGKAPTEDTLSYTMSGYRWVDHEWLTNAFFFVAYTSKTNPLLAVLFAILGALPFLVLLSRAPSLFSIWIIFMGASFMSLFVAVRPQLITFALFFVLYEILLRRFSSEKNNNKSFYFIPVLFVFWVNVHGGFAAGLLLFGLWLGMHHVLQFSKHSINISALKKDALVFFFSLVGALINPYGVRIYTEVLSVFTSSETSRFIAEWQSGLNLFNPTVIITIALFIFLVARFHEKLDRVRTLLAGIFSLLFFKSIRHGPLFVAAAIPIAENAIEFARMEILQSSERWGKTLSRILAIGGGILMFAIPTYLMIDTVRASRLEPDTSPREAVDQLRNSYSYESFGNIFNSYGWGGYLTLYAPEIKVFIDGRMPHWISPDGYSAMKDFVTITTLDQEKPQPPDAWKEIFSKYNIKTVLIESPTNEEISGATTSGVFLYIIQKYPEIALFLKSFKGTPPQKSLFEKLVQDEWKIFYKNEDAVIFRCPSCDEK